MDACGTGRRWAAKGQELDVDESVQCRWYAWAAEYPETRLHAPARNRVVFRSFFCEECSRVRGVHSAPLSALCCFSVGVFPVFAQLHFHGPTCEGGKGGEGSSIAALAEAPPIATTITKPAVVSRTSWGCPDGQGSGWTPQYTTVTHLIVHHSATANTSSDWAATVRSIWNFHTNDRGWGDVGYNYLIDPNGVIYEGRAGGDNVIGAHFSCQNGGTMGVCMLGTFTSVSPTAAALSSLQAVARVESGAARDRSARQRVSRRHAAHVAEDFGPSAWKSCGTGLRVHDDVVSGRQSLRPVAGDSHGRRQSYQQRRRRADCGDATGELDHVEFRAHLGPGR